jgi:3-hydroxyethyl bacteriochlorophyllide a dehydrogenase
VRRAARTGYRVHRPGRRHRAATTASIYDVSGDCAHPRRRHARGSRHGGEVVLAGFYSEPLQFDFAPAFMREAQHPHRRRVEARRPAGGASELDRGGRLSLDGLITHHARCAAQPTRLTARRSATPTA